MTTPNFFLMPDGNQRISERLECLSAVPVSRNGNEPLRHALRAYPRASVMASFIVYASQYADLLQAMRDGDEFMIPYWPHIARVGVAAFESGLQFPVVGSPQQAVVFGSSAPAVFNLTTIVSSGLLTTAVFNGGVMPAGGQAAYPMVRARLEGDRGFEYVTNGLIRTSLTFRLLDFDEVVPAYTGPMSSGLPLLANVDGGQAIVETVKVVENRVDKGHLVLAERLYSKRSVTLLLRWNTREQISTFRNLFISRLQGSVGRLRYTLPGDGVERTWALAQDFIEITTWRAGLAECSISLEQQ